MKKKYFSRKKHQENLKQFFGKKTFIELSKQAAKNLIIHLYKCYIRKHFKQIVQFLLFFFLKCHLDQSLCTKNCTQKTTYSDINLKVKEKSNESKKKSISSKLIKMNYDYDTICTFRVPIFRIIFADTYYIIILVKLAN